MDKKTMSIETIKERINNGLENTLGEIYKELGVETGDIAPEQLLEWDDLVASMANIFQALVICNQGEEEDNREVIANFRSSYSEAFEAQVENIKHSESFIGFEAQVNSFPGEDACNYLDLLVFGNEKNVFFFVSGEDYEGYATEKDTNLPEVLEEFHEWINHSEDSVTEEMLKAGYPITEFTTQEAIDKLNELINAILGN